MFDIRSAYTWSNHAAAAAIGHPRTSMRKQHPSEGRCRPRLPAADAIIRAEKIEKYYAQPSQNRIQVISATDLSIVPGEIVALLGPSGSGKSTMLRMLTGLSTPTAGQVYWHEKPIAGAEINVSIVFQSFALFPWLTVLENVEAPLQARGVPADERRDRSMKMLDTVGLDGFEAAYPKELSGGMKQRVGFARALVVEPEVLFMDEPFSALDVLTAENLRSELLELWANKTMPTKAVFLVTHNIEEAVLLADRIIVLGKNPGHIRTDFKVQLAQPRDRRSAPFTATGGLHLQGAHQARRSSRRGARSASRAQAARPAPDALPDAAPCAPRRHRRPAGVAARQGRPRRHLPPGRRSELRDRRPAAHRRCRPVARIPHCRGGRRGHHRERHGVRQLRDSPPEGALPRRRLGQRPAAAPDSHALSKPRATTPSRRTSSSICSTSSSARRSASAR